MRPVKISAVFQGCFYKYDDSIRQYIPAVRWSNKKTEAADAVSGKIPVSSGGSGTTENNYFKYIYPIQVSNIDTYYEKYKTFESEYQSIKTLIDLELNKAENFIKYDSSIINVKEKSGIVIKLAIGIILSIVLGMFAIFVKEFIEGYKKNKANN